MDNENNRANLDDMNVCSCKKVTLFAVSMFVLGFGLGALACIVVLHNFRPDFPPRPDKIIDMTANRIYEDFDLNKQQKDQISKLLENFHNIVMQEIGPIHERISAQREKLIQKIAEQIPQGELRQRWNKDYEKYFPRPPHPRKNMRPPGSPPPMR